jgi:hypothetical protein
MKKEAWYRPLISAYRKKKSQHLALQFSTILEDLKDEIPVIIICYNNGVYAENLVRQFNKFNIKPIVIDNKSSDSGTIETLKKLVSDEVAYVAYSDKNFGHFVGLLDPIYQQLPNYFAYTDPDLNLNKNLPKTFVQDLIQLTQEYRVYKAGFSLDLLDSEDVIDVSQNVSQTKPFNYQKAFGVREYEDRFWRLPIKHNKLEVFYAPIDSTFAIYNKSNYRGDFYDALRVAGNYSAVHLPWFPDLDIMNEKQKQAYLNSDRKKDTTWVKS